MAHQLHADPVGSSVVFAETAGTSAQVAATAYGVTRIDGTAAVMAALEALVADRLSRTGFQSERWLAALFSDVAPVAGAQASLIVVRDKADGRIAIAVPLVIRTIGRLRIAEFADLGLSDYCAPLIGEAASSTTHGGHSLLVAMAEALPDVDLIRLEKMPRDVEGRLNPLVLDARVEPSRFVGNTLTVATTVKDFLASRGKKYRKEAERSRRRLEDAGAVNFYRADTREAIEDCYPRLEEWQSARHREAGHDYWLDRPEISAFYRDMLVANIDSGFASLFVLEVDRQPVAMLLGITQGTGFTLLRISDAGEAWRHCSPGRMVVLDTIEYLVGEGVRTFDMGIGDYPFKRWIGCEPYPLYDLAVARTWRAVPHMLAARARHRVRQNALWLRLARRMRSLGGAPAKAYPLD